MGVRTLLRTNINTNPKVGFGTSPWISGGALNRVSFNGKWWLQTALTTYTYAAAVGEIGSFYAASIRINGTPGDTVFVTSTDNITGAFCGLGNIVIPAGGEIVVKRASTAAVTGTSLNFGVSVSGSVTCKVTEALIEKVSGIGVLPGEYFDGSSMEMVDRVYNWNGMVDGSTSNEYYVDGDGDPISGGGSLRNLKQRLLDIILGPSPTMPTGDKSMADIKKAALEKVLTDNGLI